jgi:predicted  nucleic acid-binding Zn-ribbon protein
VQIESLRKEKEDLLRQIARLRQEVHEKDEKIKDGESRNMEGERDQCGHAH